MVRIKTYSTDMKTEILWGMGVTTSQIFKIVNTNKKLCKMEGIISNT